MKACIGKLDLWVRKLDGKSSDMFLRLKDFVEEKSVQTSDIGIDQCLEITWLIWSAGFLSISRSSK